MRYVITLQPLGRSASDLSAPCRCQTSVLMSGPGAAAIMAARDAALVIVQTGGSPASTPLVPRRLCNRPSGLRAPPPSCLSSDLIVSGGLICPGDKMCVAEYTRMHAHSYTLPAVPLSAGDAVICAQLLLKYGKLPYFHVINYRNLLWWVTHKNMKRPTKPTCLWGGQNDRSSRSDSGDG